MQPTKNYQTQPQWSLNPTVYQNIAKDQVDWAALAQQWIQMKETCPPELTPATSPTSSHFTKDLKEFEEQGEAPMEMEKDDEVTGQLGQNGSSVNWKNAVATTSWNTVQTDPNQWRTGWNVWGTTGILNPPVGVLPGNRPPLLSSHALLPSLMTTTTAPIQEYWTTKTPFNSTNDLPETKEIPCLKGMDNKNEDTDTSQFIDSTKKKSLPAWIREGLEKMEREKQKQEEKERERREREALLEQRRKEEEEAMKELAKDSFIPKKSKFDSDSEEDDRIDDINKTSNIDDVMGKKKFSENSRCKSPDNLNPLQTREERIQELMLSVRKNLTEILLEVTNEEILRIALETFNKAQKKAPTVQAIRKTATSSLIGGLGLGIYENSTDESESENEDVKDEKEDSDSELELQETIRRRKLAFERTSREIEAMIAEEEEREEKRRFEIENRTDLKYKDVNNRDDEIIMPGTSSTNDGNSKRKIYHDKDGEPLLHDKNILKFGRSIREKKASRFSDPKDIVKNVQTHVSIVTSQPDLSPIKEVNEINLQNEKFQKIKRSHSSTSDSESSSKRESKRSKSSRYKKNKYKYYDRSKYSGESSDDSRRSSSRRSRSRDYTRSDRSEESRSSYRRDYSRSRSREKYRSSSDRYRSSKYSRDYDYKYRSRSKSKDRSYKSRKDRSESKEYSDKKSKTSSSSSSKHKY